MCVSCPCCLFIPPLLTHAHTPYTHTPLFTHTCMLFVVCFIFSWPPSLYADTHTSHIYTHSDTHTSNAHTHSDYHTQWVTPQFQIRLAIELPKGGTFHSLWTTWICATSSEGVNISNALARRRGGIRDLDSEFCSAIWTSF